uniref:Uncharacterized protein n=1 Tax=viral metagenome TaxID=1070528 RepID=A0A6C0BM52_9ZZZZ
MNSTIFNDLEVWGDWTDATLVGCHSHLYLKYTEYV